MSDDISYVMSTLVKDAPVNRQHDLFCNSCQNNMIDYDSRWIGFYDMTECGINLYRDMYMCNTCFSLLILSINHERYVHHLQFGYLKIQSNWLVNLIEKFLKGSET